jgi:uncharacterized protein (TIGR03086 family)
LDGIEQLDAVVAMLNKVAGNIGKDQFDNPTPCAQWTVRDLFNHMIGGATLFAGALRGEAVSPPEPGTDFSGDDPAGTLEKALATLAAAARAEGALDRTLTLPFGQMPGAAFVRFVALDGTVHSWDLAKATGQSVDPPDELVAEVQAFAEQAIPPAGRDGETFAMPVEPPAGATPLERLVAYAGRRP